MRKFLSVVVALGLVVVQGCSNNNGEEGAVATNGMETNNDTITIEGQEIKKETYQMMLVIENITNSDDFIVHSTTLEDDVLSTCNSSRPSGALSCEVNKNARDIINNMRYDNGAKMATAYDMCKFVGKYYNEQILSNLKGDSTKDESLQQGANILHTLCHSPSSK